MSSQLERLISHLVDEGTAALAVPRLPAQFAYDSAADRILNDIEHYPQAFVLACLCDRQGSAKRAWRVPYELLCRLGTLDVGQLAKLSEADWLHVVRNPTSIHRMPETMAKVLRLGVLQLSTVYDGDASRIWTGSPPSAAVVRRFLEFYGVGPKIATMATNILVRQFDIPLREYYSVDISVDRQVRRVMVRLGFAADGASDSLLIYAAREAHAEFPGVFDLALWNVGRTVCQEKKPRCAECELVNLCRYAANAVASV
jgi:endonuclease III